MTYWVIVDPDSGLWWSNENGWVDQDSATRFTTQERYAYRLPLEGCWLRRTTDMSMRDQALDNIEIAMSNVDHRDKVLAALIVFRQLDKGEREEVLRDGLLDYYVYHSGTGTFVDGIDNIRLVSAHDYEWDDVEAEFVLRDESDALREAAGDLGAEL